MNYRRLILIVIAILFICNFVLLLLVQNNREALSLSVTIGISEMLALIIVAWYWQRHYRAKKKVI